VPRRRRGGPLHLLGKVLGPEGSPIVGPFDIFAQLRPGPQSTNSGDPRHLDLTDPKLPTLNLTAQNAAVFNFGMIGPGGREVTFDMPAIFPNECTSSLLLHTQAHFGTDSFFDVFFKAFFTNEAGGRFAPKSFGVPANPICPGDPIFLNGSLHHNFAASNDPSFTVEIFVINPDPNQTRAAFSEVTIDSTVPEPASLTLLGVGMTIVAELRMARRKWDACATRR